MRDFSKKIFPGIVCSKSNLFNFMKSHQTTIKHYTYLHFLYKIKKREKLNLL